MRLRADHTTSDQFNTIRKASDTQSPTVIYQLSPEERQSIIDSIKATLYDDFRAELLEQLADQATLDGIS